MQMIHSVVLAILLMWYIVEQFPNGYGNVPIRKETPQMDQEILPVWRREVSVEMGI